MPFDSTQHSAGMSRRVFVRRSLLGLTTLGVASSVGLLRHAQAQSEPIKIGVLHSLTGTMAISETSLRDIVLMAVEEINATGGVLGRQVQPVVVDPASDWPLFAEKAKQLLLKDKVAATFGCWTSISRKEVLPVFEEHNGLLFYPVQYEGEECSRNIFYTGATPNQQLLPAARYLMSKEGGAYKRFYLLGTDYVFPRTANKILRAMLLDEGIAPANIQETYTPFSHQDYQVIVKEIKQLSAGGATAVLSTINGDSNVPFYKEFARQGLTAAQVPIMAFSVAEDELRSMDITPLVGHFAAWNYFQSLDTPENKAFVSRFQAYCEKKGLPGGKARVTDDPIEAAYFGVYLWKAAVEKAGTIEVNAVRQAAYSQNIKAPGGMKRFDDKNHHTSKPIFIGKILATGQFEIVWQIKGLVRGQPWNKYTGLEKSCDWSAQQPKKTK